MKTCTKWLLSNTSGRHSENIPKTTPPNEHATHFFFVKFFRKLFKWQKFFIKYDEK